MEKNNQVRVNLSMTLDQAKAVSDMMDLANRIHLCQFTEIAHIVRYGDIKKKDGDCWTREEIDTIENLMNDAKSILGFSVGASFGINNGSIKSKRAYEIAKVLDKTMAEYLRPNPEIRGNEYDGLTVRYTTDPAPIASIIT